jgi:thiol:disulfide interchange protein DsbC
MTLKRASLALCALCCISPLARGGSGGTPNAPADAHAAADPRAAADPHATADAHAAADPRANLDPADPRTQLLKRLPAGAKPEDLRPSPIPGLYEFAQGADVSYITTDGKYFIDGNLYDMDSRENLTETLRTRARVALISAIPESQMLIFSPDKPRYTITVFTDIDCPYCRKLHSEMPELNKLGIRVRYMFFPRTGPNTESWRKAEAVWCAPNRNDALTRAKAGGAVDTSKTCGATPVAREYSLGEAIGVRGTPAILTEDGQYISGYMPPQELLAQIKSLQVAKR